MLRTDRSSTIRAGATANCGNCGSFVKVGHLPVVGLDDSLAAEGAADHRIECPQCCSAWAVLESDGDSADVALAVLQNEHRRGRSGKIQAVSSVPADAQLADDPAVQAALHLFAQREELDRQIEAACHGLSGTYSLRVLEPVLPPSRSQLSRLAAAGRQHEAVESTDIPEF